MDLFETDSHSFIIRVWSEETSVATPHVIWRGHITHVPGGERRYLRDLNDISPFIVPYLEEMGVKLTLQWRLRRWLNWWKLYERSKR